MKHTARFLALDTRQPLGDGPLERLERGRPSHAELAGLCAADFDYPWQNQESYKQKGDTN